MNYEMCVYFAISADKGPARASVVLAGRAGSGTSAAEELKA